MLSQTLKKNILYILSGLAVLLIILIEAKTRGDFDIFLAASKDLLHQKNIYQEKYSEWYHYFYSVSFALVLAPFTFLPVYFVKVLWLILNVYFVSKIWSNIQELLPLSVLPKKIKVLITLVSFLFVLKFLRDNFHVAQVTILILFLTLQGLKLIWNGKDIQGAFLLALGIDIKLLPIVFIPYLFYRKKWKALVFVIGFIVGLTFLPALFIGFEYNAFLLGERFYLINPQNQEHILDTSERSFHSLTTLLSTLFVENSRNQYDLFIKRNIANLSLEQLSLIINITRLFFIGLTLYFLQSKPFKKENNPLQRLYEVSYICLIIPLIFPHQQHYAFLFVFPATSYCIYYCYQKYFLIKTNSWRKYSVIILLVLIFFLLNSHFILGTFIPFYDHFKTLTYGSLLLVVMLMVFNPKKY
jgi:hypothetical protein